MFSDEIETIFACLQPPKLCGLSWFYLAFDDSDVLVEAEDAASEQERLRHIVEQTGSDIVDFDHLISYERDAAHDEQHRTGILGDFEAFVDFHGLHCSASCSAEDKGDDVTDCL